MPGRRQHGEGSLYQRERDGRWVAAVELGRKGGKRDRRTFTGVTAAIAMERRDKFLDARRDGFVIPAGRQPWTDEWMLHWLHNVAKREVAATTWNGSYRQKVTKLICPYFERVPLGDLTEEHIEHWHAQLEAAISARTGRPLSASTIGQAHRIFSRGLKAAVKRGRMARNPCSNVTPPSPDDAEIDPPSTPEVIAVLDRCRTWPNGARWVLGITTGLRQGEILGLEWRDVRLRTPASVTVRQSAARVSGERVVKVPKSRASRRTVPLASRARTALRELQGAGGTVTVAGTVFTRPDGRPVHPRADWQDWQDLLADLGLPRYRVHDMRHGYATVLLEEGVDPRVVQAVLGHSTGVLLTRYQHVRPVMHQQVADAIDRALGE